MDPTLSFIFYLAAIICFGIAAFAPGGPGLGRGGGARIGLVPLGLALWLFPTMWAAASAAF